MRYRRISTIWLKIFCVTLIAAFGSFGTGYILFKTIGLPNLAAHRIKKTELKDGLQRSSWCFRIPERPLDTAEYSECGISDNGQELLSHPLDKKFKPMAVNKYFKYIGMEGPYGWGIVDNLRLYWKGKNLYYGYYPGAFLVRNTILAIMWTVFITGIATILLLGIYPIIMLTAFVIYIGRILMTAIIYIHSQLNQATTQ